MLIAVTRPQADAGDLLAALEARGHAVFLEPLLTIVPRRPVDWPAGHDSAQALLITSANGLRAFADLDPRRDLPVYAVGDASAAAARTAGFSQVRSAAGTVEDLARMVGAELSPLAGPLLQPAASRLAGDLQGALEAGGFEVLRAVIYDAEAAQDFSVGFKAQLNSGLIDAVTLFSPRTAATFVSLIRDTGLSWACQTMTALCLSDAVAGRISELPWRAVLIAERPDQKALLARLDAWAESGA